MLYPNFNTFNILVTGALTFKGESLHSVSDFCKQNGTTFTRKYSVRLSHAHEAAEYDKQVTLVEVHSEYSSQQFDQMLHVPDWARDEILEKLLQEMETQMEHAFGPDYKNAATRKFVEGKKAPQPKKHLEEWVYDPDALVDEEVVLF